MKASQDSVTLAIPRIVLTELDGLKNSNRTATSNLRRPANDAVTVGKSARSATAWLLDVLGVLSTSSVEAENGTRAIIRGQRRYETAPPQDEAEERSGHDNDGLILRFAIYAARQSKKVVLLSNDKVLCLRARFEGGSCIASNVLPY